MNSFSLRVLLVTLTSVVAAQNRTSQPPIKVVPPAPYPPLGPAGVSSRGCTVQQVGQIELRQLVGQPNDTFHCILSVKVNGGSTWDLLTGTWVCDGAFTKNADVAHLNTAMGDEFAGSISNDLKLFVYDAAGTAKYCTRTSAGVAFGAPHAIAGVPAGSIDPKLLYDGALEKIAYKVVATGDIVWADFDRSTGTASGAIVLASGVSAAEGFHSPEPLRDPTGTVRALLLGKLDPLNLSDAWYASGKFNLPPTVAHLLHDTPPPSATYLRNGTALGGTAIVPEGPAYGNPLKIDFEATNCDVASDDTDLVLCNFFPYKAVDIYDVSLLLGDLAPQPLQIGGARGLLGLDLRQPIIELPWQREIGRAHV